MIVNNNGKNPNDLHDFLLSENVEVISLKHNRVYSENGEVITEATEIHLDFDGEEQLVQDLIEEFMSS